jgi:D-serine deaminase-like pyridoxal phosphate-dependent protein
MVRLKEKLSQLTMDICLSIGDTPCCSIMDDFTGIDEIRPGNFVFYDVMQYKIGSCDPDDIAVAMACPVIARYPERNEFVIYGGAVHFSKDHIVNKNGDIVYGIMVDLREDHWKFIGEQVYLSSVSQEHGIVKTPKEIIRSFDLGDTIGIIPVHSCLTAACMGSYVTLTGERIDTMNKSK